MRLRAYAVFFLIVVGLSSQLVAFDGLRKGFILGGGAGPGYLLKEGTDRFCLAASFKIGYAPSNSFEIYYLNTVSGFGVGSDSFINGLTGLGLTKYLRPEGRGFFVFGGAGLAVMEEFTGGEDATGFGLIGGIGYDIAKHWSIQGDIIYTTFPDVNWQSVGVRVTVNFLAF